MNLVGFGGEENSTGSGAEQDETRLAKCMYVRMTRPNLNRSNPDDLLLGMPIVHASSPRHTLHNTIAHDIEDIRVNNNSHGPDLTSISSSSSVPNTSSLTFDSSQDGRIVLPSPIETNTEIDRRFRQMCRYGNQFSILCSSPSFLFPPAHHLQFVNPFASPACELFRSLVSRGHTQGRQMLPALAHVHPVRSSLFKAPCYPCILRVASIWALNVVLQQKLWSDQAQTNFFRFCAYTRCWIVPSPCIAVCHPFTRFCQKISSFTLSLISHRRCECNMRRNREIQQGWIWIYCVYDISIC